MRECLTCHKLIALAYRSNARYCSTECRNIGIRLKRGGSRQVTCLRCGKRFWSQYTDNRNPQYCSRACRNGAHQVKVACDWCGAETSKFRSRSGYGHHFCSDQHRIYWLNGGQREPTRPEMVMCGILTELGIPFRFQQPHGPYILDFALTEHRIDVEVDGEYWHALRAEHDARRDRYMTHHGWRVLRFPSETLKDSESVKHQLRAAVDAHPSVSSMKRW